MSEFPRRTYLVCATPRSGSTLLCEALSATGVAGRPTEPFEQLAHSGFRRAPREYFSELEDPSLGGLLPAAPAEVGEPLGPGPYGDHVRAAIERGTTANGVFATKLMWGYLQDFLDRIGGDLDTTFGDPAYVLVKRRDKLRQAISLWRALQTQSWRHDASDPAAGHEPEFSAPAIAHLRDQLAAQQAQWVSFLRDPLTLVYEDFTTDVEGAVRAVLDHIGVDAPEPLTVAVPLRRQSDELTDAWVERFQQEAA